MGYDYGFHLVLVKPPKEVALKAVTFVEGDQKEKFPIETYAKEVVAFCKDSHDKQDFQNHEFYFPQFGVVEHGGGRSYGCGDQNNGCRKTMAIIGQKFPDAVFALYHYYWDISQLTLYTFQGDKILNETFVDFENYKIGEYTICMRLDFMQIGIEGNLSMFFNDDFGYDFDFKYEKIYEYAGVPIPPPKQNPYALYPIVGFAFPLEPMTNLHGEMIQVYLPGSMAQDFPTDGDNKTIKEKLEESKTK